MNLDIVITKFIKKMYNRIIQKDVEDWLNKGKIVVIYGARQVGKTTLVQQIMKKYEKSKYYNCDFFSVKEEFSKSEIISLTNLVNDYDLIVLDEAQRVKNIGLVLKIIYDNFPGKKIIATGSSSFELANKIKEPLTGRAIEFHLNPLSVEELLQKQDKLNLKTSISEIIRFGTYPDVYAKNEQDKIILLQNISEKYLYQDILEFENIKKSDQLFKLLQLLALQIGSEVSFEELANKLQMNKLTVEKYINLLEKTFVIFSLRSFSRNLRKEISKSRKIFFYDLGIRNALINNFNDLEIRDDRGALWENFCILERKKRNINHNIFANLYFWRTYDQKEIDLVEERDGKLFGFEFKWGKSKNKEPKLWKQTYQDAEFQIINQDNFLDFFVMDK